MIGGVDAHLLLQFGNVDDLCVTVEVDLIRFEQICPLVEKVAVQVEDLPHAAVVAVANPETVLMVDAHTV